VELARPVVVDVNIRKLQVAVWSPDRLCIVTVAKQGHAVKVWDARSGKEITQLAGHGGPVLSVAWSPDGNRIVTASADKTARVWVVDGGREIARLKGHFAEVNSAVWSPDGRCIVTTSADATARVWDVSRTQTLAAHAPAVVLTAALTSGRGLRTELEAADLLMQDAAEDLHLAALSLLSGDQKALVSEVAAALWAPLHPNCYLSQTQLENLNDGADADHVARPFRVMTDPPRGTF
jgi:dipeptidyl aminopeptidase/acylaminoacyl peptidase